MNSTVTSPNGTVYNITLIYGECLKPGHRVVVDKKVRVVTEQLGNRSGEGAFMVEGSPYPIHYRCGQRFPRLSCA